MGINTNLGSKRRAKRAQRKTLRRRQNEYWIWAVIYITLLFGFDLLYARMVSLFIHTQASSPEMLRTMISDHNGISIQNWGLGFAIALLTLWCGVGWAFRDIIKLHMGRIALHLAGVCAAMFFIISMFMMATY